MSYLVLARKYRPKTFSEVIGQEHITTILEKAIEQDKVAHAYLFCGPRGVGKTSCARLLAKALIASNPNQQQDALFEDLENTSNFDIIEIDGASNRGIDEIRTLRENAKFAPLSGSYKIYIVDEVHMLTGEAFNALLKTLEEPPAHVKFIFATTEINKVPETIISRCQRFDFKRLPVTTIIESLKNICTNESIGIDDEAIYAVAKSAKGGMRDALSILDQMAALSKESITSEDVYSMLGLVETNLIFDLVDCIGVENPKETLAAFYQIIEQGKDVKQFGKDLIEHFRHLMIIKVGGKSLGKLVNYPIAIKEMFLKQSEAFSIPQILKIIETLIQSQEYARIMESHRTALEIVLTKVSFNPQKPQSSPNIAKTSPQTPKIANNRGHIDIGSPDLGSIKNKWNQVIHEISQQKISVASYLQEGIPIEYRNGELKIAFDQEHAFQKECLEDKMSMQLIEESLQKVCGKAIEAKLVVQEGLVKENMPNNGVEDVIDTIEGEVINQWPEK